MTFVKYSAESNLQDRSWEHKTKHKIVRKDNK